MHPDFKTILVTGASGQLGRRLAPHLLKAGYNLRAHYRTYERASKYCPPGADAVVGDLIDPAWMPEAVRGCQAVIHGAARVSLRAGNFANQHRINVEGTTSLLSACINGGVTKLVFISSIVTVGASADGVPINEAAPYNLAEFDIPYFRTKRESENRVLAASGPGLDTVSVNPSIMISRPDREVTHNDLRKIPRFLPAYFDFGLNLVDTDDVVTGVISALERGRPGERYILSGEDIDAVRAFEIALKYFGLKKPFLKIPQSALIPVAWLMEISAWLQHKRPKFYRELARLAPYRFFYSHQKATNELGYNPGPLEETIKDILDAIKTQGGVKNASQE